MQTFVSFSPVSAKSTQASQWEKPQQKEQRTQAKGKEAQIPPVYPTRPKTGAQWGPYGLGLCPIASAAAAVSTLADPYPATTALQLPGHSTCICIFQVCAYRILYKTYALSKFILKEYVTSVRCSIEKSSDYTCSAQKMIFGRKNETNVPGCKCGWSQRVRKWKMRIQKMARN